MIAKIEMSGTMEVAEAGKAGSGSHVLNFLGGSIFLTADVCPSAKVGEVKEAVIMGEVRKADYGFNIQPKKVVLK